MSGDHNQYQKGSSHLDKLPPLREREAVQAALEFAQAARRTCIDNPDTQDVLNDLEATLRAILAEPDGQVNDAAKYRWLRDNNEYWSWNPSRFSGEIVSGFSSSGTGYLGFCFDDAVDSAIKEQK